MNMANENGFTLVELLITIVVLSILLTIGAPSFMEMIKNNRLTAQTNSLVAAIQATRNEAIKRGTGMVICSKDPDDIDCSGDNDWTTGWIVFSDLDREGDLDGDGICTTADDHNTKECVLRTIDGIENNSLTGNSSNIQFDPSGQTVAAATITLIADDCYNQQVRIITVTSQGHTSVAKDNCPP